MRRTQLRRAAAILAGAGLALGAAMTILGPEVWRDARDGGFGGDAGTGVAIDGTGHVLRAGWLAAAVGTDGVLTKWDADGVVEWERSLDNPATTGAPSASNDRYSPVCVDGDDDVIVAGAWSGDVNGADGYANTAIVRKYSSAGVLAWEWKGDASYGRASTVTAVTTDAAGNVYAAGTAFRAAGTDEQDWALWKFDADGHLADGFPLFYGWSSSSQIPDYLYGFAVDGDGAMIAAGVRGVADDANPALRDEDWHVRKYAADRSLVWEDTYAGAEHLIEYPRTVAVDANGDVYVAGSVNAGTDNASGADTDLIVVKYAGDTGERVWTRIDADATGDATYYEARIDEYGHLLLVGTDRPAGDPASSTIVHVRSTADGSLLASEVYAPYEGTVMSAIAQRGGRVAIAGRYLGANDYDALTTLREYTAHGNRAPVLDGAPTASASLAAPDEGVAFHASATDADGDPLTYSWDFGDGVGASGPDAVHAYAGPGARHVVVTVADGTDEATGSVDLIVGAPFVAPSIAADVNFRRPSRDVLTFKGRLVLPEGFVPDEQVVRFDAGGVTRTWTLDARGRAKSDDGTVKLTYVRRKALWSLTVVLARGDYAGAWADEGLVDDTVRKAPVAIKATAEIGEAARCAHVVWERYTAKSGKWGRVR